MDTRSTVKSAMRECQNDGASLILIPTVNQEENINENTMLPIPREVENKIGVHTKRIKIELGQKRMPKIEFYSKKSFWPMAVSVPAAARSVYFSCVSITKIMTAISIAKRLKVQFQSGPKRIITRIGYRYFATIVILLKHDLAAAVPVQLKSARVFD